MQALGPSPKPGSIWRNGSGPPPDSLGINGDYYLDADTGIIYTKSFGLYILVSTQPIGGGGGGGSGVDDVNVTQSLLPAMTTVQDGDQACAVALSHTPRSDSSLQIAINGQLDSRLGDGVKTGCDFYFSLNGGSTALPRASIVQGATCHWNGSIAGYQLGPGDLLDFIYERVV